MLLGCSTPSLRSISVTPTAGTEVLSSAGQTVQYHALGSYQQGRHAPTTDDITNAVTWSSSNIAVATVSSAGVVTAVGSGTSVITATGNGASGILSGTSDVTVTLSSANAARTLTSISVVPNIQTVTQTGETVQYVAIGSYTSAPLTQDLTSQVTWAASDVAVARMDGGGLATTVGFGTSTIIASYTPAPTTATPNPATISATALLTANTSVGPVGLPTIAVYKVGANASAGGVTANYTLPGSSTEVQAINCAPNASSAKCTGNVPVGVTVTFATTTTVGFGGWSSNCTPLSGNPYSCSINVPATGTANLAVGAIFN